MFERTKNDNDLLRASLGSQTQKDAFGVPLQGSPKAFGVLVGRYQSLVCTITYSATGSVERSEELAQEVFLRAWRSLSQLQDLSKFRAWLCSIARSTVQNWFRDRQRDVVGRAVPLDAVADKPSEESGPEEAAMIQEQRAVVSQALSEIPESLREPLILFYREQKSIQEVAEQFGLTENTARQRISRGRKPAAPAGGPHGGNDDRAHPPGQGFHDGRDRVYRRHRGQELRGGRGCGGGLGGGQIGRPRFAAVGRYRQDRGGSSRPRARHGGFPGLPAVRPVGRAGQPGPRGGHHLGGVSEGSSPQHAFRGRWDDAGRDALGRAQPGRARAGLPGGENQ